MTKNKIQFKIIITEQFTLKCSYIDSENKETLIHLPHNKQEEYIPNITFSHDMYSVCKENENAINFLQSVFENPKKFHKYKIHVYGKEYHVIAEILLSLIIYEFKQRIEKEFIIEKTLYEMPSKNANLRTRIKIAIQSIGCEGITISPEHVQFDYSKQGGYLEEILEKKNEIDKREQLVERAKKIAKQLNKEKIHIKKEALFSEETFRKEIQKFSLQERSELKLCQLDNKALFIASHYFPSIDDHKNLAQVCRKVKRNMDKFNFNPVSLDKKGLKLFSKVESFHLYGNHDEYLEGRKIHKYVDWRSLGLSKMEKIKKEHANKTIEFKRIVFSQSDLKKQKQKQNPENEPNKEYKIIISEGITEIEDNIFEDDETNTNKIVEIQLPESLKTISMDCFGNCSNLTNITIPLNETRVVYGNKIFNNQPHFNQSIYLPDSIKVINGNEVDGSSITIPSFVTALDDYCFYNCDNVKEIILPETLTNLQRNSFKYCLGLTNLTITLNETQVLYGNQLFNNNNHFDSPIYLPTSLQCINGKKVDELTSLTVPSNVTSIDENCFTNSSNLKTLILPKSLKETNSQWLAKCSNLENITITSSKTTIPLDSLEHCKNVTQITLPLDANKIILGNRIFNNQDHLSQPFYLPPSIKMINGKEVDPLFITIPENITSLDNECFHGCDTLEKLILPYNTLTNISFVCYENCQNLTNISLELNKTRIICGNKIFNNKPHFNQSFNVPSTIKVICGKPVNSTTFEIPSYVTSFDENCFDHCENLKELILPKSLEEINWNWLSKCSNIEHIHINSVMPSIHNDILVKLPKLKGVSFSSEYILEGRKIFYEHDKCLYSIQLPPSVSEINGTHVQLGSMRSFTIPNDVTKLSDCCFRNCLKITEIKNMKKEGCRRCHIAKP